MPGRETNSAQGARLLSALAGMSRAAPAYVYEGALFIAAGATKIFCQTTLDKATEGAVVGYYFEWQADDLQTSPISLVPISAQGQTSVSADTLLPPFTLPCKKDGFWFPHPYGVELMVGRGAGLQITNNEAVTLYARGWIALAKWDAASRRDADRMTALRDAAPWGSVFGDRFKAQPASSPASAKGDASKAAPPAPAKPRPVVQPLRHGR